MANENEDIEQKVKITYDTNAKQAAKDVNKLDDAIQDTTESQKESGKQTKENKQGLEDLGGGIGGAIKGFKGLIKTMWALVANPVGLVITAIVLAVTTLFKAFTSTKEGAEKFDQVMAGIGATIDVLRDRVLKIAGAIAKFFSGDFAGAMEDGMAAVSGIGDEIAEEFKKAADATESLQRVEDAMRDLSVSRAKLNRDLVRAKEIIESETASYEEKKKAIAEVQKAETEQTEKELANAQKKLDAIKTLNALSDSGAEDLQAQADAEKALFEIQQKSAEDRIKNIKLIKKSDNEERARLKQLTAVRQAAAKEREKIAKEEAAAIEAIAKKQRDTEDSIRKAIEDSQDENDEARLQRRKEREIAKLEALAQEGVDTREALMLNDQLFNALEDELREKRAEEKAAKDEKEKKEQLERDKKFAAEQAAIEKAALDQKRAIEDAKIGILGKTINLAKNLFGKSKDAQKAAVVAESAVGVGKMVIDNNRANIGALATPQAIATSGAAAAPTIAANNISTGIGIASSIAATSKALQALGGGSAGGAAGSPVSGSGGASAAPRVDFQASSENQIATSIAENTNEQPPLEAFVVESKVTTAQALARKKIDDNSFG